MNSRLLTIFFIITIVSNLVGISLMRKRILLKANEWECVMYKLPGMYDVDREETCVQYHRKVEQ